MITIFVLLNLISFLCMGIDKYKAKKRGFRISERTLFLFALPLAAYGSLLGMLVFHHKIRKPNFYIGIPILCILQTILFWLIVRD